MTDEEIVAAFEGALFHRGRIVGEPKDIIRAVCGLVSQAYEEMESRVETRLHANAPYPVNKSADDSLQDVLDDIAALKVSLAQETVST